MEYVHFTLNFYLWKQYGPYQKAQLGDGGDPVMHAQQTHILCDCFLFHSAKII